MAKVLVVDDSEEICELLMAFFMSRGYKDIMTASDAGQAMQQIRQEKPKVLITDIIMPGESGVDLIKKLRQEGLGDCGIIAISGGGRVKAEDVLDEADVAGAFYTFTKPFDLEKLLVAVEQILSASDDS